MLPNARGLRGLQFLKWENGSASAFRFEKCFQGVQVMCYRLGVLLELLLRHTRLLKQSEGQFAALAIGHHSFEAKVYTSTGER